MERRAGMNDISSNIALKMPEPVNTPNVWMVLMSKTKREKNPVAAIRPADIITGATLVTDSTTASLFADRGSMVGNVFRMRWYSS